LCRGRHEHRWSINGRPTLASAGALCPVSGEFAVRRNARAPCSLARTGGHGTVPSVREVLILTVHPPVAPAKLLRPGGVRAVAAESPLLEHRPLVSTRSRPIRRESRRRSGTTATATACTARSRGSLQRGAPARSVPLPLRSILRLAAALPGLAAGRHSGRPNTIIAIARGPRAQSSMRRIMRSRRDS